MASRQALEEALAAAVGPLLRVVTFPEGVADVNALAHSEATAEDLRVLPEHATTWLDLRIEAAAQAQESVARGRAIEGFFPYPQGNTNALPKTVFCQPALETLFLAGESASTGSCRCGQEQTRCLK